MSSRGRSLIRSIVAWAAVVAAVAIVTGLAVYVLNMLSHGGEHGGILESIGYAVIYASIFILFNQGTLAVMRRMVPLNTPRALMLHILVQTFISGLAFLVATAFSALVVSSNQEEWMDVTSLLVILAVSMIAALVLNTIWYGHTFYKRMMEAQQRASESRLTALKAQINPHFLFNTLNSITSLIRIDPQQAEEVTQNLSDLFRFTLAASKKKMVPLRAELESVRYYLEIEQVRFGERLEVQYDINTRLLEVEMPSFVLQPLVENAVKHGVAKTDQQVVVTISAEVDGETMELKVADTGPGFASTDKHELFSHGTALENIDEQLTYHFGKKARMTIGNDYVALSWPLDRSDLKRIRSGEPKETVV